MTVKTQDILEDIHRMKCLAISKGYALSSLVLLIDDIAHIEIRRHDDYTQLCLGDKVLGLDTMKVVSGKDPDIFDPTEIFYDVVVRLGAAEHIEGIPSEEFTLCGKEPEGVY